MKKMICFGLCILLLLTACSNNAEGSVKNGKVVILTEDTTILSDDLSTQSKTVEDALLEVCQKNKIPYTLNNNMFDNFGGIPSSQTDGWILYVNGEVAQAGAKFIELEDNFLVEFKYVNYDEVF